MMRQTGPLFLLALTIIAQLNGVCACGHGHQSHATTPPSLKPPPVAQPSEQQDSGGPPQGLPVVVVEQAGIPPEDSDEPVAIVMSDQSLTVVEYEEDQAVDLGSHEARKASLVFATIAMVVGVAAAHFLMMRHARWLQMQHILDNLSRLEGRVTGLEKRFGSQVLGTSC